jgi:hypothetical protein
MSTCVVSGSRLFKPIVMVEVIALEVRCLWRKSTMRWCRALRGFDYHPHVIAINRWLAHKVPYNISNSRSKFKILIFINSENTKLQLLIAQQNKIRSYYESQNPT